MTAETRLDDGSDWQLEREEWLAALDDVLRMHGPERASELLRDLYARSQRAGAPSDEGAFNTPYRNTIPVDDQPAYPGDLDLEQRIENIIRWNALAMVVRANEGGAGVGGHIATYASAATMLEVGFNHFFRRPGPGHGGDLLYLQAHASPGIYARAYLEGRLSTAQVENFRRELSPPSGLPSYPHPQRMPDFWPAPTASMGLSTVSAIYQARFARYLENRGLKPRDDGRVWAFIGDGEADEPEVAGTIGIAAREKLDNLILCISCNLQRLDGPVRGNGKIIQELERTFRGAGWNVIKVIWGSEWDALFERDHEGRLQARMEEAVDGDYQMYSVLSGKEVREHWVRGDAALAEIMKTLSDEAVRTIRRGGHDQLKIYAAYERALRSEGRPTVILVKTIKGYGLGERAEGRNTAHQKKNMSVEERNECARRFGLPLNQEQIKNAELYRPPADSAELRYLEERRRLLGGPVPARIVDCPSLRTPPLEAFSDLLTGSGDRDLSTTKALVGLLGKLLRDPEIGRYIVPIVPDEARTFGMDGLFRQAGIYSPEGQLYRPVDAGSIAPYVEATDGQILQEGICEVGAIASFIAAGTAYANHGVPSIPFYLFYSIFGFQRVGDMIWAAGDQLCRGFLIGATSGRTTLNGEGLQHQDGHSHLVAASVPSLLSYDPAYAHELAVLVREGIRRMYERQEDVFYYLTVTNENYEMPPLPDGAEDGIVRGLYRCREPLEGGEARAHLFGSGAILQQALRAQELLAEVGTASDVWSVTSYTQLHRDALDCARWNRMHPEEEPRSPHVAEATAACQGPFVAASDYVKMLPESISQWLPGPLTSLGTDGWGLSESRPALRDHFQVSAEHIAYAALVALAARGEIESDTLGKCRRAWL